MTSLCDDCDMMNSFLTVIQLHASKRSLMTVVDYSVTDYLPTLGPAFNC